MALVYALFSWGNLPFTIALGLALAIGLLQLSGLLGLFAGDGDASDAGDGHGDAAHGDLAHGPPEVGLGERLPCTTVGLVFAVCFAFTGLAINTARGGEAGALSLLVTAPVSAALAAAVTAGFSRVLRRTLAGAGRGGAATSRADLAGRVGVVVSSRVDEGFGQVRVVDGAGHTHWVSAAVRGGDGALAEGTQVVLVEYDREGDKLLVAPLEADDTAARRT